MRASRKCFGICLLLAQTSKYKDPFTMNRLRSDQEKGGFQPGG